MRRTIKKIKFFLPLTAIIAALAVSIGSLSSCTQNQGHIGDLFGFWWLDEIEIDGQPDPDYGDNTFFSFMANNVVISLSGDETLLNRCIGTWEKKGNEMNFNFDNHSDAGEYPVPAWIYLSQHRVYNMTVLKYNSKHLWLQWVTDEGKTITYKLSKTL